ncbi:phosphatase PAP2 family protein [Spirillospora sp. NPDC029432]|uniref:phosphatase PAP2 family protein n=1 Tax=Spirillospora sp. NPDC029432 TaxID=3154599 RepID=UPI00345388A0
MLTGAMHVLSFIGSAAFYLPLLVVLYWCVDARLGARAAVVLSLGSIVNTWLKLLFHDPRPFWTDPSVTGHEPRDSFGMPSGHAQNAVVTWGFLASLTRRRLLWAGALLLIIGIGVSRVALGVHSAGQVLAGWGIGAAVLVLVLRLEPHVVPWWFRRPLPVQLALSLAVGLAFLGGMWAAVQALDGWRWPASWVREIVQAGGSVEPITLGEGAGAAGGLFGLLAGLSYAAHRIDFDAGGELWRRLARIPVGAAGALGLYVLGLFLGTQPVQAFFVHALLGLWAAAGAPELFVRLGLAARTPRSLTRAGEEAVGARQ